MSELTFFSSMGVAPTYWAAWVDALLKDAWIEPDGCGLAVSNLRYMCTSGICAPPVYVRPFVWLIVRAIKKRAGPIAEV